MNTTSKSQNGRMLALTFIPLAIAINVGIGAIVKILNLPIYMDSIGTIIATLLLGWEREAGSGKLFDCQLPLQTANWTLGIG